MDRHMFEPEVVNTLLPGCTPLPKDVTYLTQIATLSSAVSLKRIADMMGRTVTNPEFETPAVRVKAV